MITPAPAHTPLQRIADVLSPTRIRNAVANVVANVGSSVAFGLEDLMTLSVEELQMIIAKGRESKMGKFGQQRKERVSARKTKRHSFFLIKN